MKTLYRVELSDREARALLQHTGALGPGDPHDRSAQPDTAADLHNALFALSWSLAMQGNGAVLWTPRCGKSPGAGFRRFLENVGRIKALPDSIAERPPLTDAPPSVGGNARSNPAVKKRHRVNARQQRRRRKTP